MDNNILNKRTLNTPLNLCKIQGDLTILLEDTQGNIIAEARNQKYAEFIVKAVNNYDSLLEALKLVLLTANKYGNIPQMSGQCYLVTHIKEIIQKCEQ